MNKEEFRQITSLLNTNNFENFEIVSDMRSEKKIKGFNCLIYISGYRGEVVNFVTTGYYLNSVNIEKALSYSQQREYSKKILGMVKKIKENTLSTHIDKALKTINIELEKAGKRTIKKYCAKCNSFDSGSLSCKVDANIFLRNGEFVCDR